MDRNIATRHVGEIPALTMVRFAAAFGVLLFHSARLAMPEGMLRNIASSGYSGVALFFILSGFILTYVYHHRPQTSLRDFYLGRVARIYPVYVFAWLLFAVCFVREAANSGISTPYAAKAASVYGGLSLVLVQAWLPGVAARWNWPGWSLSVETLFYALFPLFLIYSAGLSRRAIVTWLVGAAVANVVLQWAIGATLDRPFLVGSPFQTTLSDSIGHFPLFNLPRFIMGIALARLFIAGVRVESVGTWLVIVGALTLATLAAGQEDSHWGPIRRDMLLAPEFAALIYLLALYQGSAAGPWGRLGVLLGRASYALYIVQTPIGRLYWGNLGYGEHDTIGGFLMFAVIVIAVSVAIHLWIEVPAEKVLKRWLITARRGSTEVPATGRLA
jgi:peptidoglycan/LPS O-acetylase OafA/YrhL